MFSAADCCPATFLSCSLTRVVDPALALAGRSKKTATLPRSSKKKHDYVPLHYMQVGRRMCRAHTHLWALFRVCVCVCLCLCVCVRLCLCVWRLADVHMHMPTHSGLLHCKRTHFWQIILPKVNVELSWSRLDVFGGCSFPSPSSPRLFFLCHNHIHTIFAWRSQGESNIPVLTEVAKCALAQLLVPSPNGQEKLLDGSDSFLSPLSNGPRIHQDLQFWIHNFLVILNEGFCQRVAICCNGCPAEAWDWLPRVCRNTLTNLRGSCCL